MLYLSNWEFNSARILEELDKIVRANGGRTKIDEKTEIQNSSYIDTINEYEKRIERFNNTDMSKYPEKIQKLMLDRKTKDESKVKELKELKPVIIEVSHIKSIYFIIQDTIYYYCLDSNPFFEFYYIKAKIKDGKYPESYVDEDTSKDKWLWDCFFIRTANNKDVKKAAEIIYNTLLNADYSKPVQEKRRQRVSNTYNDSYHYETIVDPINYKNIKF